jgi:soluble lytic murein transglycosylase-like protein
LLISFPCYAQDVDVNIVIQIESGGDPNAYNKKSGAIGLMQITPIVLKEYNQLATGRNLYTSQHHYINGMIIKWWDVAKSLERVNIEELFDETTNIRIGYWYLNTRIPQMLSTHEIPDTINSRLISYNAGIKVCKDYHRGKIKKLPRETRNYLTKYHKLEGK